MTPEQKELREKIWLILDENDGNTDDQVDALINLLVEEGILLKEDDDEPEALYEALFDEEDDDE